MKKKRVKRNGWHRWAIFGYIIYCEDCKSQYYYRYKEEAEIILKARKDGTFHAKMMAARMLKQPLDSDSLSGYIITAAGFDANHITCESIMADLVFNNGVTRKETEGI